MKRGTWVLLIALVALVAVLVWWLRKKAAASPTGVVTIGPVTVASWNPPPAAPSVPPTQQYYPDGTPVMNATAGDVTLVPPSPIGTVTRFKGLGVGQSGGLLL